MAARHIGLLVGAAALLASIFLPTPAGMQREAFIVAGLVVLMAAWWMTEALPLTATALMPFIVLPFAGVMSAKETASAYYSDILFLLLGGGFIALAIERTGLHRRLALGILSLLGGRGGQAGLLLAFMIAAAILSMLISNTSTTLIMMPMAVAVLAGGGVLAGDRDGLAGALPMGIAFAASIGGLGTLVGSPTNAISVGLLDTMIGTQISFAEWSFYGFPIVLLGVPLAAFLVARVQRVSAHPFDVAAARAAVANEQPMGSAERRLMIVVALTFAAWMTRLVLGPYLPEGSWTDGTIAIIASLALFLLPDGTGRPLLVWEEANRAPWGVIMMFGCERPGRLAGQGPPPAGGFPAAGGGAGGGGDGGADHRVCQQCRHRHRDHPGDRRAGGGAGRRSDPARYARRACRELGVHAARGHRPQCDRLVDRAHPYRPHGQGRAAAGHRRHIHDRRRGVGNGRAGLEGRHSAARGTPGPG